MLRLSRAVPLLIGLLFSLSLPVTAQSDQCPAFIDGVLNQVSERCAATGRNQACYGHVALDAEFRPAVSPVTFTQPGDLTDVVALEGLRLRAFDLETNTWGVALMKLQANLPAALPGQNVTFVLFGDVLIRNDVPPADPLTTLEVTSTGRINVRALPSTGGQVIGSLRAGETVTANGRIADGTWLRIAVPDSQDTGWVFAELVTPSRDVASLAVVDAAERALPFTPMQAFTIETGISGTTCAEAPQNGVVIQTPQGVGEIQLRANDVEIRLGSTAVLRAQAGDALTVSVVEGQGEVTADGVTVQVPAGAMVAVPLDEEGKAAGAPGEAMPYEQESVAGLPVALLPETIAIAPPANVTADTPSGAPMGLPMLPGMDMSDLSAIDPAFFCPRMAESLAQSGAGITIAQLREQLRSVMGLVPAESRGDLQALLAMLDRC